LSLAWLIPATIVTVMFFALVVYYGLRAQFGKTRSGVETMIGQKATAIEKIDQSRGRVSISGEIWNARSDTPIGKGEQCEVLEVQGLMLQVQPLNESIKQK